MFECACIMLWIHMNVFFLFTFFVFCSGMRCKSKSRDGSNTYVCCRHYEPSDGKCVECKIGFTSHDGQPCRPCSRNHFGRRCALYCKCSISERCDNVKGCVEVSPSTETAITDDHVEGYNEIQILPVIEKICTVLIFFILVSLVIFSLSCICWKYNVSCKKREQSTGNTDSTHPIESGNNPSQGETHQYDEVDVGFLNRESSVNDGQDMRSSESSNEGSGICGKDSDGYLNPYHALKLKEITLEQGSNSDQPRTETSFIHTQENKIYFADQMQN